MDDPVKVEIRKLLEKMGTQKAVADHLGISDAHVSDILNGKRNAGPDVLASLGITRIVVHVPSSQVVRVMNAIRKAA